MVNIVTLGMFGGAGHGTNIEVPTQTFNSGGFVGGGGHVFPIIELEKIEEKDINIDIIWVGA